MTDFAPLPTPPLEPVWPPAPLHGAVPPPLFVSAEGIEVTQSGNCLLVVNHFVRRVFIVQMCVFSLSFLSPFYTYWTSPFHHATWKAMLPAVLASYKQMSLLELLMLFMCGMICCLSVFCLNLNGIVLDPANDTAKTNGRINPLSRIKAVRITRGQPDILRRQFIVSFVWNGDKPVPWWRAPLVKSAANTSFLGLFRLEANAEKVADAVAKFAAIPVQHWTR